MGNAPYDTEFQRIGTEMGHNIFYLTGTKRKSALQPKGVGLKNDYPSAAALKDEIIDTISRYPTDEIIMELCCGTTHISKDVLPFLKGRFPNVKVVLAYLDSSIIISGDGDVSDFSQFVLESARNADKVFCVDESVIKYCKDRGCGNLTYVPAYGISEYFHNQNMRRELDVVWVGGDYGGYNEDGEPTILRTKVLEKFHKDFKGSAQFWGGRYDRYPRFYYGQTTGETTESFHTKCNELYNTSKIGLACDVSPCRKFFSPRLPNIMLAGAMALTSYQEGYEELFKNHSDLVWFKTPEEALELCEYYLKNGSKRHTISQQGQILAQTLLTRESYVKKILGI